MSSLLKSLTLHLDEDGTFIALPNGEVVEFTELSNALYVDHREQLGGDSLGAVCINLKPVVAAPRKANTKMPPARRRCEKISIDGQLICESFSKDNQSTAIENQWGNGELPPDGISVAIVAIEKLEDEKRCRECGLKFEIDLDGISKHFDDYGDHDWASDVDHVPYAIEL